MVKFIHNLTGTEMWVADERKDEYLAAGHKLAAESCAKPAEVAVVEEPKKAVDEEPKKASRKKTVSKGRKR